MSMAILYAWLGRQYNRTLQINNLDGTQAIGVYTSSTTLAANVYEGQSQTSLFQPTVTWYNTTGYNTGQIALSVSSTQLSGLDPAGEYRLLIDQTTGGVTSSVWEGRFKVLSAPGSNVLSPPDLITYDYAEAALSELNLTDTQRDFLPYLVSAASNAIRKFCNRNFDLRTGLIEIWPVPLDGLVRLTQPPIQIVTRVQGIPTQALTIQNTSSSVQNAVSYFAYTGYQGGYGSNAQVTSGLTLAWTTNGVPATAVTLSWSSNETVGALASAISAVESGWSATANSTYSEWAVTELMDNGWAAQGCDLNSQPGTGAIYNVWLNIANAAIQDQNDGFIWVGQQLGTSTANLWGPGGDSLWGRQSGAQIPQVKVTYNGGFYSIPADVQYQCAQLVKWKLELGIQELLLQGENAADYGYQLADKMAAAMPITVRQALGRYVIHYA